MNPRHLLLALTLAANLLLAALVARAWAARFVPSSPAALVVTNAVTAAVPAKATRSRSREIKPSSSSPPAAAPSTNSLWATVESADFPTYIQNLRTLGVPEDIVRDFVRAEISHRYRPRQIALWQTTRRSTNYWENGSGMWEVRQPTPQVRRQLKALEREMTAEMKALLGEDALFNDNPLNQFFVGLAPELRRQIMALDEARDLKHEQFDRSGTFYDEEADRARKQADREYYAALAKLLPADQLEAFKLRYSDTASQLRHDVRGFTPTEEEFKILFRLREARDAAQPLDAPAPMLKPDEIMRAQQAEQQSEKEAVLAALGPERAKEFEVLKDHDFYSLVESGVPSADLIRLDAMKQSLVAATDQLKANAALTAEQRHAAHEALRLELEREVAQLIGERRANYFLSTRGPNYFGEIVRRPREVKP